MSILAPDLSPSLLFHFSRHNLISLLPLVAAIFCSGRYCFVVLSGKGKVNFVLMQFQESLYTAKCVLLATDRFYEIGSEKF